MESSKSIEVSVVIVSYNVRYFVLEGIGSIYTYLNKSFEVILVDNCSGDGTIEAVKEQFPEVTIISNIENVGFSSANNQAFEICKGNSILMLNPDASFVDESINLLVDELITQKDKYVILGPKIVNPDLTFQHSCWRFPSPFHHLLELVFLNTLIKTNSYNTQHWKKITQVDFLSGACIAFSKETLNRLTGLDKDLFWMDDVDFCKRNREIGGENYFYPGSTIRHYIGQSSKKNQRVVISNQIISKLKYYKKHNQKINFILSVPIFIIHIITRIPVFLVLGVIKSFYLKKAAAYTFTFKRMFDYLFLNEQSVIK